MLDPGTSGAAYWLVWHDTSSVAVDSAELFLEVKARYMDPNLCSTMIALPGIPGLPFAFQLSPSGSTQFCEGDSITLDAGPGQVSYLWNTQETTRSITVRTMGAYWCQTWSRDGRPGFSDTLQVVVMPAPAKPVITRQVDSLIATEANEWQWFRDGHELPGATAQACVADQPGGYRVRVRNASGCEAWSEQYDVFVLGVEEAPVPGIAALLYPNPTTGIVTVKYADPAAGAAVVRVTDVLGREVYAYEGPPGAGTHVIDLSDAPNGMYYVYVRHGRVSGTQSLQLRK
jgi:hypothetical protein